jgi:hypothetical protein
LIVAEAAVASRARTFHGITLAIAGDLLAARLLRARFVAFPPVSSATSPELTFAFRALGPGSAPDAPDDGVSIYDFPGSRLLYAPRQDELHLACEDAIHVACNAPRGSVVTSVRGSDPRHHWLAAHLFFTIPFIELLKRRGLYSIHAGGLCLGGRALLLAGPSGSGKSTLTAALIEGGFEFLGDDLAFLSIEDGRVLIHAFPDELDIAPDAAAMLPRLAHLAHTVPPDGTPKHRVPPSIFMVRRPPRPCRPGIIVLPRVSHTDRSTLTAIEKPQALVELAPNVLLTEPCSSQAHLDALGQLVSESACYRLDTGRDLDRVPDLLRTVLT